MNKIKHFSLLVVVLISLAIKLQATETAFISVRDYGQFLNAMAMADPHGLSKDCASIVRFGEPGYYSYGVAAEKADEPMTGLNWLNAARYCNWKGISSKQAQEGSDGASKEDATEVGSYELKEGSFLSSNDAATLLLQPSSGIDLQLCCNHQRFSLVSSGVLTTAASGWGDDSDEGMSSWEAGGVVLTGAALLYYCCYYRPGQQEQARQEQRQAVTVIEALPDSSKNKIEVSLDQLSVEHYKQLVKERQTHPQDIVGVKVTTTDRRALRTISPSLIQRDKTSHLSGGLSNRGEGCTVYFNNSRADFKNALNTKFTSEVTQILQGLQTLQEQGPLRVSEVAASIEDAENIHKLITFHHREDSKMTSNINSRKEALRRFGLLDDGLGQWVNRPEGYGARIAQEALRGNGPFVYHVDAWQEQREIMYILRNHQKFENALRLRKALEQGLKSIEEINSSRESNRGGDSTDS